jgi:hypothetical protein
VIVIHVLVATLLIVGLAGTLLPFLPGTPLILLGVAIHAVATEFQHIGPGRLLILTGIAALAFALDYVAGAMGARRFGGSRWAVVGALLGAVAGLFLVPYGLILGPLAGAVAGEMARGGRFRESLKTGVGTLVGMVAGAVAKLGLAVVMVSLFLYWTLGST